MRIDHDLIKLLLNAFEALPETFVTLELVAKQARRDIEDEVVLHQFQMMQDAGYILRHDGKNGVGIVIGSDGHKALNTGIPFRLTAHGHEFLASINNPEIWTKAKAKFGTLGMEAMKEGVKGLTKTLVQSILS